MKCKSGTFDIPSCYSFITYRMSKYEVFVNELLKRTEGILLAIISRIILLCTDQFDSKILFQKKNFRKFFEFFLFTFNCDSHIFFFFN